jgi:uncharacterized membrane protein
MQKLLKYLPLIIILASVFVGFYFYPQLSDPLVSHWDAAGNPNGQMPKFWFMVTIPAMMILMYILFLAIPLIDPLKENIKKFRSYFDLFVNIILLFLLYTFGLTIYWNLGNMFNMSYFIIAPIAILLFFTGILLEKTKRNWFIGIRTPWTMSSDVVWEKTHKHGAIIFKVYAVILLLAMFVIKPEYLLIIFIVSLLIVVIWIFLYSYLEYNKLKIKEKK